MFVCGNVGLFAFNETLLPRTQLIAAGFKTIGVTAVLGKTYMAQLAGNTDLKMIDPEKLLNAAVPLLKTRANYLVLLAHTTRKEAIELAKKYPDFDLVICSDFGGAEPPAQAEEIRKGGTKLIVVGEKGMYAVVLGMYDDPQQPLRYQRVTLDSRFPASPEMTRLDVRLPGPAQGPGAQRAGHSSAAASAQAVQRRLCRHRCLQELPRRIVPRLEEVAPLPRLCHAAKRQSAAELRSGVHQLPRRGLAPHAVLPLSRADTSARRKLPS